MYSASGVIRDYNASLDTCSVELTGVGVIDTWLDGIGLDVGIDRHFVAAGVRCTILVPDPNRLCEAIVSTLALAPSAGTTQYSPPPTGPLALQSVRLPIATGGTGAGSTAVTWPVAFSATPSVSASADGGATVAISAITATGCTLSISSGAANSTVYVSAVATGG
jgi:hypothetical protein